jgi:hypothetical protein
MHPAKGISPAKTAKARLPTAAPKPTIGATPPPVSAVVPPSPPQSSYWAWLSQWKQPSPHVGWCHTTDGWGLREILRSGSLEPRLCPVFNEPLTYFFYGRPAYRLRDQEFVAAQVRAPVIFMFTHDLLSEGKRVFPFDSGAFGNKRYTKWFHENSALKDFEIPAGSSAPELQVSVFFENLERYFNCEGRTPPLEINGNFEAEAVMNMLTDAGIREADDRRVAVELQTEVPLSIHDKRLAAVVLPKELQKADYVRDFLSTRASSLKVIPYNLQRLKLVREYQSELERIAREFYCAAST